jgi:hypothetical protein
MESGRPREEWVAAVEDEECWLLGFESRDGRLLWCGCGLGGSPEEKNAQTVMAILKSKNTQTKENKEKKKNLKNECSISSFVDPDWFIPDLDQGLKLRK